MNIHQDRCSDEYTHQDRPSDEDAHQERLSDEDAYQERLSDEEAHQDRRSDEDSHQDRPSDEDSHQDRCSDEDSHQDRRSHEDEGDMMTPHLQKHSVNLKLFSNKFFKSNVCECFVCMSVCAPCARSAGGSQRRTSDQELLEPELQLVVSHHMGAGN